MGEAKKEDATGEDDDEAEEAEAKPAAKSSKKAQGECCRSYCVMCAVCALSRAWTVARCGSMQQ